ncbi:TylF/MycF family methyltransferase [Patescibacteria group bacterium]|nr:TylF/MycF family methyltransferase [Patescibacteria group bacterium]
MFNIIEPIYKLIRKPRFRYSLFIEGMRRLFYTYDEREAVMKRIMEWAFFRDLKGDYMEFGVYEGNSFIRAFYFAKFRKLSAMKFYAFDSFSGYPPLEGIDKDCGYFEENGYEADLKTFKKNLTRAGVDMKRVRIIPSLFSELNQKAKEKIESKVASVVWIDCDLYKATLESLNFLNNYITDGTIIVFADWFACNGALHMGQPRAVREWLENNPNIKLIEFSNLCGKVFIVSSVQKIEL